VNVRQVESVQEKRYKAHPRPGKADRGEESPEAKEQATMPDVPDPGLLGAIHRHLAAPVPGAQAAAIEAALDLADQAAMLAWDNAEGQDPLDRLLLALQTAAEELTGIGAALAAGEKGE
jgi:hypothetical protein